MTMASSISKCPATSSVAPDSAPAHSGMNRTTKGRTIAAAISVMLIQLCLR